MDLHARYSRRNTPINGEKLHREIEAARTSGMTAGRQRLPNKPELPRTRCKTYRRRGVSRPIAAACKTNNWRSLGEIAADLVRVLEAVRQ